MRSFVIDSNALVYWLHEGSRYHDEVNRFLMLELETADDLYVLSSSLNEVYYALHAHYMDEAAARASILDAASLLDVMDLTGFYVHDALASDEPDYEDGLIRAFAESLEVDAIISYDKRAFKRSRIPKLTAAEALQRYRDDYEK